MFQNEATFIQFVKEHGEKYGLKEEDDFDNNLVTYIRHFYQGLIENYNKIDWTQYTLSKEEGKQLQLVQLLQLMESNRNNLDGIKKHLY